MNPNISILIVTRDRVDTLLDTLQHLIALPEHPPIIVVDNQSTDGTPERVRAEFPNVTVLAQTENQGVNARNIGVRAARTPLVAFCDDDSWWEPGALTKAVHYFEQYPHLGVLAGKVLLGEEKRLEPVCEAMRDSPLTSERSLPGPAILGFVCCAVIVRRNAFLAVGGFNPQFAIAGEERLFSADMLAAGWSLAYAEDVVSHHFPSPSRNPNHRIQLLTRDTFWYYWLRRPLSYALRHTWHIHRQSQANEHIRRGYQEALQQLPSVLAKRRVVPSAVEEQILKIESYY